MQILWLEMWAEYCLKYVPIDYETFSSTTMPAETKWMVQDWWMCPKEGKMWNREIEQLEMRSKSPKAFEIGSDWQQNTFKMISGARMWDRDQKRPKVRKSRLYGWIWDERVPNCSKSMCIGWERFSRQYRVRKRKNRRLKRLKTRKIDQKMWTIEKLIRERKRRI